MSKKASLKRNLVISGTIVILLACIGVSSLFLLKKEGSRTQAKLSDPFVVLGIDSYAKEKAYWRDQINTFGTEKAYELFKKDTEGKEYGVAHTLSHVFGQLIFEKEGLNGVSFCDSAFAFGCYHSFFGAAIAEKGLGAIPELADSCLKRWGEGLGCPHGIGHGILGYLGDDKLVEALDICDTLPWKRPFGGCHSGVFMEFNFHTMQSISSSEDRPLDPKNPYDPCNRLPKKYGEVCYFEEPQWWSHIFSSDYAKIASLCLGVKDEAERNACYQGVGNIAAPEAAYDALKTKQTCLRMPNKAAVALCLERASWAVFAAGVKKANSIDICADLTKEERIQCAGGPDPVRK